MDAAIRPWHARGLLFENCNCTLVCPGHMHFEQNCTHPRCKGYWAICIDAGEFDGVALAGAKAVIAFESPQRMIDGGWTEVLLLDTASSPVQRDALQTILGGRAGGPWEVLARFVGRWLETRVVPIEMEDEPTTKRVRVRGLLEATVTNIRGRDRARPVMFDNIFNQIHASSQVLATGQTAYDDGTIVIRNDRTHGLHSNFEWIVR
jgi:hypothetical protein